MPSGTNKWDLERAKDVPTRYLLLGTLSDNAQNGSAVSASTLLTFTKLSIAYIGMAAGGS